MGSLQVSRKIDIQQLNEKEKVVYCRDIMLTILPSSPPSQRVALGPVWVLCPAHPLHDDEDAQLPRSQWRNVPS